MERLRPIKHEFYNGGGALISDRRQNSANNFLYDDYMENDLYGKENIVAPTRQNKSKFFFQFKLSFKRSQYIKLIILDLRRATNKFSTSRNIKNFDYYEDELDDLDGYGYESDAPISRSRAKTLRRKFVRAGNVSRTRSISRPRRSMPVEEVVEFYNPLPRPRRPVSVLKIYVFLWLRLPIDPFMNALVLGVHNGIN